MFLEFKFTFTLFSINPLYIRLQPFHFCRPPLICSFPSLLTSNSFITFATNLRSEELEHDLAGFDSAVAADADDAALLAAVLPPPPHEPAPLQRIGPSSRIAPFRKSGWEEVCPARAAGQNGGGRFGSCACGQRELSLRHTHSTRLQPPDSPVLAISCLVCRILLLKFCFRFGTKVTFLMLTVSVLWSDFLRHHQFFVSLA